MNALLRLFFSCLNSNHDGELFANEFLFYAPHVHARCGGDAAVSVLTDHLREKCRAHKYSGSLIQIYVVIPFQTANIAAHTRATLTSSRLLLFFY